MPSPQLSLDILPEPTTSNKHEINIPEYAFHAETIACRQYFATPRSEQSSQWQRAMIATILLFPSVIIAVVVVLNSISLYYATISAIPFVVILKIIVIWTLVALPLSIAGTIFGRHSFGKIQSFPCRVNAIPRYRIS
jgi:hypothetical protein